MKKLKIITLALLTFSSFSFAGKKALIWDDTETLGKGNYQNENYFFYTKRNTFEKEGSYIFNLTYGYNDKTDLALNIPVGYVKNFENTYSDVADPFFEVKYRFFEGENVNFAIKPFIGIPINKDSDFSEHHLSYGITLISQANYDKVNLYANSSYMVHRERLFGKNELFQSISFEYNFSESFSLISSVYISIYDETEEGGLIGIGYNYNKIEIGLGIGKNFRPRNDYSIYAGITFRFF